VAGAHLTKVTAYAGKFEPTEKSEAEEGKDRLITQIIC